MLQCFVSDVYMFMNCAKRLRCIANEVHSQLNKKLTSTVVDGIMDVNYGNEIDIYSWLKANNLKWYIIKNVVPAVFIIRRIHLIFLVCIKILNYKFTYS